MSVTLNNLFAIIRKMIGLKAVPSFPGGYLFFGAQTFRKWTGPMPGIIAIKFPGMFLNGFSSIELWSAFMTKGWKRNWSILLFRRSAGLNLKLRRKQWAKECPGIILGRRLPGKA